MNPTVNRSGRGWAYTGAIIGGLVSVAANVAHSFIPPAGAPAGWHPEAGAVVGAIVWPVFLFIAVEILARVAWPTGSMWRLTRWAGLLPVALVAAFVSYRHLSGLLAHYGEDGLVQHLGPIAVDGLMVMATGALIATGIHRTHTTNPAADIAASEPSVSIHHDDSAGTVPAIITAPAAEPVPVPAHLLPGARFAVTNHEQTTGRPITPDELSARIGVTPALAGQLLTAVNTGEHTAVNHGPAIRVNGTQVAGLR
jgi:hypothetical protein